jgi:hypothetical protein
LPPMESVGELVAAAVVDARVWDAYGQEAADGIYLVGQPGPAMPFLIYRAWKVPTGYVNEEVRFYGPSGRLVHRWGPVVRRMIGSMDLTTEIDPVEGAVFDETGTFVVSFVMDGEIVGEIEVPVAVQVSPTKLGKDTEDGLKKSDVIWVGVENNGRRRTVPAWFTYKNGKILLVSQKEPGPEEQTVPGVPDAHELVASQRVLEGAEWEAAAAALADRRRSRNGPPGDAITRWRTSCDIVELTPSVPG